MKKLFLTMFALGAAVAVQAETVTIQHATAGAMADELAACGTATNAITELIVQGEAEVTADDFTAIRTLAKTLKKLDLSGAVFANNTLPATDKPTAGVLNNMTAMTECVLPETLTALSKGAFVKCSKLEKINIPDGVAVIPAYCFNKCFVLSDITLPAELYHIQEYVFEQCGQLPFTELPEKMRFIGEKAFVSSNVAFTEFPETVESLGKYCFQNSKVAFYNFPPRMTALSDGAFYGTQVTFSTIPDHITKIGPSVFEAVKTMTYFEIPDVAGLWSAIPTKLFYIVDDSAERTFVCRSMTPPAVTYSFSKAEDNPNTTFKVPYKALDAYKAAAPYSAMNLQPITVPVAITVECPEGVDESHVAVALVVEDVEHTDFTQEVIEGEGKLTVGFADEAAENLYVKTISRSITADVNLLADGNWETIYSCDKPEDALKQAVEVPLTVDGNMGEYHVEIATHGSGDTAIRDIQAASSEAGELYDMAGRRVYDANGLKHGVYLLRTHETVVKIVK